MQISKLGLHNALIEQVIGPGIDMTDESVERGRMQLLNRRDQVSDIVRGQCIFKKANPIHELVGRGLTC